MHQMDTSSLPSLPDNVTANPPPSRSSCRFGQMKEHAALMPDLPHAGSLAGDTLYGANAIAKFMYGARDCRRAVYNLIENRRIPHFRLGATVCARKSVLMAWIAEQEAAR
jgi:hypothetical protein